MNHFRRQTLFSSPLQANKRQESLSEQRYADLLKSASDFFASSVEVTDDERQTAIDEINKRMVEYGLTAEDLM
jgi:type III secretory pathway lipoprotein EscJ